MTAELDADCEDLLFEVGKHQTLRSRELAQADAAESDAALSPLSEVESRALIAATLARTAAAAEAKSPLGAHRLQRRALFALTLASAAGLALLALPRELPEYELSSPRPDAT